MNGQYFLIYTTEEGGFFKSNITPDGCIVEFDKERFKKLKKTGKYKFLNWLTWKDVEVEPKLIMLVQVVDNFDFILGAPRDSYPD